MAIMTQILGRLVADPELRKTGNDVSVCSLRVASDRNYKNAQGEKITDFINCVVWRKDAETVAKWLVKGNRVFFEGTMEPNEYDDKKGVHHKDWQLVVQKLNFIDTYKTSGTGAPSTGQGTPPPAPAPASNDDFTEIDDDGDLPF